MEEEKNENETVSEVSQWFKDNLRIIISVIIVIAIAGGIYSYSKRTQPVAENNIAANEQSGEQGTVETGGSAVTAPQQENKQPQQPSTSVQPSSQETEGSFAETAGSGDGVTHLARRALANYLEKNPDSSLTPEHKIYIEDYLRKNVGFTGRVHVGTTVEFSKSLISQAIEQSKKLNDNQLKNLHKYAVLVPSLS
jgi:hypothetical protein